MDVSEIFSLVTDTGVSVYSLYLMHSLATLVISGADEDESDS
jgi:hypothetical protein